MDSTKEKTKRKLNGFSIICIVYLSVAVFMSAMYLIAAINNQLDVSEETMSPVASVITFSCFMVIPPLIWFIVLICKKRLFFDLNIEQKNAYKKYLKSDIKIINDYVELLSKNEKLTTIIKNFVQSHHTLPSAVLQYAVLPLKQNYLLPTEENKYKTSFKLDGWIKYLNVESNYVSYVKKFNQECLKDNLVVKFAYKIRDNRNYRFSYLEVYKNVNLQIEYDNLGREFIEINNLYDTLKHQEVLLSCEDDYNLCYYAFLFLVYRENLIKTYQLSVKALEGYGLDNLSTPDTIIKVLYENDDADLITTVLWSLEEWANEFNIPICNNYDDINQMVKVKLKELKEKEQVESLLNNEKKRAAISLATIDLMSGEQFEIFITNLFNNLGYKAEKTKASGDQGIDVIATKGKVKIAIQTKCYSKPVGNHAIMEAVAGGKYYNADKVMVVTNSTFTRSARELAQANNVILWDRSILKEKMEEV